MAQTINIENLLNKQKIESNKLGVMLVITSKGKWLYYTKKYP